MTVEQVAQWLRGGLANDEEYVVPPMAGRDLARALSLASIEPQRRYHKNRFGRAVAGTPEWMVEESLIREKGGEMEQNERTKTYIRTDGTGFREYYVGGYRGDLPPDVTEFGADHVHQLSLTSIQFWSRQGKSY
jgi:hypothetical protein